MENESKKGNKNISYEEAVEMLEAIPEGKKKGYADFIKVYDSFYKQKNVTADDLTCLLTKGIARFPNEKVKLLTHVYSKMKTKSAINIQLKRFILNRCTDMLKAIEVELPDNPQGGEYYAILHKASTEADSIRLFIREVQSKNDRASEKKIESAELVPSIYMFLAIMIEEVYKSEPRRSEVLLDMERTFVEESLSLTDKDRRSAICQSIPKYIDRGQYKSIASLTYLYYDYRQNNQSLESELESQKGCIARLNAEIDEQNISIRELKIACSNLQEENSNLKSELKQINDKKSEAEDRLKYETNRLDRQNQAQGRALAQKYNQTLGLEIDGVEDIIEYVPENAKKAIQERIDRMRQIIDEI